MSLNGKDMKNKLLNALPQLQCKKCQYKDCESYADAIVEKNEEQYALDNGWCPSNIWYDQNTNFVKDNKIDLKILLISVSIKSVP